MSFYQNLNNYYDLLFPFKPQQAKFLSDIFQARGCHNLLDVACGTGSQSAALAQRGFNVQGVDLDESMIKSAAKKGKDFANLHFKVADMLQLSSAGLQPWEGCFCIGNSLVHLDSDEDIVKAIKSMSLPMKTGTGTLVIQIVNFSAVLNKGGRLPLLEGEEKGSQITFERWYEPMDQERLYFCTRLTAKGEENNVWENKIPLRSLSKDSLQDLLLECGFATTFYGDFQGTEWSRESGATIAVGHL